MIWRKPLAQLNRLSAAAVALVAAGVAALAVALVNTSLGLTNPAGYQHHPGASELPPSDTGSDPGREFGLAFETVAFNTADGSTLRGWLVPAAANAGQRGPRLGVVTVHGRASDRRDFLRHLPMLHELGLTVLLFDLREHGLSDGAGRGMSLGFREAEDVRAAAHYLRGSGVERVLALGMSLGAGSAILAAAADPAIDAVVAESPFSSMQDYVQQMTDQLAQRAGPLRIVPRPTWWPTLVVAFTTWRIGVPDLRAPIDVVDRVAPRPLLLIHGTADSAFLPDHSRRLLARAGLPSELWLAEGAEHTRVYDAYPNEYRDHMAAVTRGLAAS